MFDRRMHIKVNVIQHGPYLNTLEGKLYIPENGWIATGHLGERWAIHDDIFSVWSNEKMVFFRLKHFILVNAVN